MCVCIYMQIDTCNKQNKKRDYQLQMGEHETDSREGS